jgi:hypothetical protein
MQIKIRRVGDAIRLGDNTRVLIHRRQGERVVLGAIAPVGTPLIFDGVPIRPQSGTAGTSNFFFSLQAIRRFTLGHYAVQVWLPGELVPSAAECQDWLHFGIAEQSAGWMPSAPSSVVHPCGLAGPLAPLRSPAQTAPRATGAGLFFNTHE